MSSMRRVWWLLAFAWLGMLSVPLHSQQTLYDRYVKVTVPSGWSERRSWELGDDRSIPLYNRQSESTALVWGFDRPLYAAKYIESLSAGDRLARHLEMDLSQWPAEVTRYYAMLTSGPTARQSQYAITVGPSLSPAKVNYLGPTKSGRARVELVQYVSEQQVTPEFAQQYKLAPEFVGMRLQILLGQARFQGGGGYVFTACRFTSLADADWVKPLLEGIEPVAAQERKAAEQAERVRDIVSHAAAAAQNTGYSSPEEALGILKAALELQPQDDNGLLVRGEILVQQHKLKDAEEALRAAIQSNPENERARADLAQILADSNREEEAQAELAAVKRLSPLYPHIEDLQARLRARQQRSSTTQP
jgi:tetratricopeptide (TPR) repeat protein